jgi:hypothetical protein
MSGDDNKGENIIDRIRREWQEKQATEFKSELRRRNLIQLFEPPSNIAERFNQPGAELRQRFGLTANNEEVNQ